MKKITTFLALLLTCIIGATAAGFVPRDGAKYLIKCKGDSKFAIWNTDCKKTIDGTEYNSLSNWDKRDERSLFTFVSTGDGYFYIKPAADETHYVFAVNTIGSDGDKAHAEGNVAVKEVSDGNPDDACKWTISAQGTGWNIKPKGGDNGWNNRGGDGKGNATIGQWYGNNQSSNIWYIIEPVELNGYYTMRTKDGARGPYLYNDFSQDNVTRGGQLPSTVSNKYVWHVTSSAYGDKLTLVNGEGTLLGTSNSGTFETLEIAWNDGTYHFFSNQLDAGNANAGYQASTWGSASKDLDQDLFRFDDASYTSLYTVNCNNADGYVTYNTTSEKAKNGGFFNIATTPAESDFTVKELEGYEATITIDNKVIKVVYAHNYAYAKAEAEAAIAKKGVGYPTAAAAARVTLNKAIADAAAAEPNITTAATLLAAVDAYKKSKADIQMPEDGKAYVITNIHKTGGKRYMRYQADGTSMIARDDAAELPIEATYICHKVGEKYVFANNSGTYLTWRGKETTDCTNSNKGYTTSYNPDYNTFTVAANTKEFGCLSFGAKRDHDAHTQSYYIVTRTGSFERAGFSDFYDENNSSAFTFEEVTYPNTITFHDAQNINGVSHIATFSAPFATIIPADVKAYYVSAKGTEATMTAIDAQVIPANQGVILTSESGDAATMVPAAGETAAAITGNQLGHSAGAARALTAGEGYILGNGTEGTAFYPCKAGSLPINKAYLLGNGESAIVMNFGNAVTGINTIAAPASAKAPIFDLSGRRVVKATKGLYIQNGKKVIVK
ncbi:hypothetical protein [Prevotellamassilia timonensis]|uniref:RICIN domain-containing protein n=1 Tax=Prevotellamassilia timonensis TaxID=1852370 RepID=UPI00307E23EF